MTIAHARIFLAERSARLEKLRNMSDSEVAAFVQKARSEKKWIYVVRFHDVPKWLSPDDFQTGYDKGDYRYAPQDVDVDIFTMADMPRSAAEVA